MKSDKFIVVATITIGISVVGRIIKIKKDRDKNYVLKNLWK